jgi:hypothetical protein
MYRPFNFEQYFDPSERQSCTLSFSMEITKQLQIANGYHSPYQINKRVLKQSRKLYSQGKQQTGNVKILRVTNSEFSITPEEWNYMNWEIGIEIGDHIMDEN